MSASMISVRFKYESLAQATLERKVWVYRVLNMNVQY